MIMNKLEQNFSPFIFPNKPAYLYNMRGKRKKKGYYPVEVIIDNIDQETGVTAEQLYYHLHQTLYLAKDVQKLALALTEEEKLDAIHDTVIGVHKKMTDGIVPNKNYHTFKDYLFIAFKNELGKRYVMRGYLKNIPLNRYLHFDDAINEDEMTFDPFENEILDEKRQLLKMGLKRMPKQAREIIQRVLDGEPRIEIALSLGLPAKHTSAIIYQLKQMIIGIDKKKKVIKTKKTNVNKENVSKSFMPNEAETVYNDLNNLKSIKERIHYLFNYNITHEEIVSILGCSMTIVKHWMKNKNK